MVRTILIFMCGFVSALIVVALTSRLSEDAAEGGADASAIAEQKQDPSQQKAGQSLRSESARASVGTPSSREVLSDEFSTADPTEQVSAADGVSSNSRQVRARIDEPGSRRPTSEISSSSVARRLEPIPIAPEIAELFESREGRTAARAHAELEAQGRDAAWSAYMEQEIAAYLFGKQDLIERFSFPVVHCRSSMCEVQAVSYSPDALELWVNSTGDIYHQPWFEFTSASSPVSMSENATVLVLQLRNQAKEQRP